MPERKGGATLVSSRMVEKKGAREAPRIGLPFERPIVELELKIGELKSLSESTGMNLNGELTLWARIRVDQNPTGHLSLVDRRHFRDPEDRSYGLYVTPGPKTPEVFGIGGQVSADGTSAGGMAAPTGPVTGPPGSRSTSTRRLV